MDIDDLRTRLRVEAETISEAVALGSCAVLRSAIVERHLASGVSEARLAGR